MEARCCQSARAHVRALVRNHPPTQGLQLRGSGYTVHGWYTWREAVTVRVMRERTDRELRDELKIQRAGMAANQLQ